MLTRKLNIINLFLNNVTIGRKIIRKLSITQRQLDYDIESINHELELFNKDTIKKNDGMYYYNKDDLKLILNDSKELNEINYSSKERSDLITLAIIIRRDELSLNNFSIDLGVSKNTILNDIKYLKKRIKENHQLEIIYSRKYGYDILGDEWDIRNLLKTIIRRLYGVYNNNILESLYKIGSLDVSKASEILDIVENKLKIKYIDENYYTLSYFISGVLRRINMGRKISGDIFLNSKEIIESQEANVIYNLSNDIYNLPIVEKNYLALHLLGSQQAQVSPLHENEEKLLKKSLTDFIRNFEKVTLLNIPNKNKLITALINHFKPAYYRIKYNFPIKNRHYNQIVEKYGVLHSFINESIFPIELFLGEKIPEHEIANITLFVGGHILAEKDNISSSNQTTAIIICQNGITMSKILEEELKNLFPAIHFYPTLSVREFSNFFLPFDLVFSTVPVNTDRDTYIIKELLRNKDKYNLKQRVINDLYNINISHSNFESVLSIAEKYMEPKILKRFQNDLSNLLLNSVYEENLLYSSTSEVGLKELLTKDFIEIYDDGLDWNDVLKIGSESLIRNDIVNNSYKTKLFEIYKDNPEHIMLRNSILIPHIDPSITGQKLGAYLILVKDGIKYHKSRINVVIFLTTPDEYFA